MGLAALFRYLLAAGLVAVGLAGCGGDPASTTAQVGSDVTSAAITSCLDTARAAGFSLSADDCSALDELNLLCDSGLPECGAGLAGEDWLRACHAINVYYLGGDPESPMTCRESLEARTICDNGWPDIPDAPDGCTAPRASG